MNTRPVAPHWDRGLNVTFGIDNWCIGEGRVFAVFVDRIDAETVNPLFQPEVDSAFVDRLSRGFVVPV
jgi:hypothetical protein